MENKNLSFYDLRLILIIVIVLFCGVLVGRMLTLQEIEEKEKINSTYRINPQIYCETKPEYYCENIIYQNCTFFNKEGSRLTKESK